jgi:hypothetical protein
MQGLKPVLSFQHLAARLKSCPDTKRILQNTLEAVSKPNVGRYKGFPQGLKPAIFLLRSGTAEAVPFQNMNLFRGSFVAAS